MAHGVGAGARSILKHGRAELKDLYEETRGPMRGTGWPKSATKNRKDSLHYISLIILEPELLLYWL